jgi:hypothetical protein
LIHIAQEGGKDRTITNRISAFEIGGKANTHAATPKSISCGLPSAITDSTIVNITTKPKTTMTMAIRGILTKNNRKTGKRRRLAEMIAEIIILRVANRFSLNMNNPTFSFLSIPVRKR